MVETHLICLLSQIKRGFLSPRYNFKTQAQFFELLRFLLLKSDRVQYSILYFLNRQRRISSIQNLKIKFRI